MSPGKYAVTPRVIMSKVAMKSGNLALFAIFVLVVPNIVSTVALIRSITLHLPVDSGLVAFAGHCFVIVVGLLMIDERHWRYAFYCLIVSIVIKYVSKILYQMASEGAIYLALVSALPLLPALFFFWKFRTTQNVEIRGLHGHGLPGRIIKILIGLGIVFLIFYGLRAR